VGQQRFETDEPALPVGIPARILNELCEHAREAEPEECCGLVVSEGSLRYGRAVRCHNEMTRRHEEDPDEFPRDSRSAYYMSMRDVLEVSREAERSGEHVTAVYHSHVGAGAYLSKDDLAYARHALFPFPFADQIVLSVIERSVREIKIFVRSGDDFSERFVRAEA
jgi:proteasome lid subunit RPN8/RPN11